MEGKRSEQEQLGVLIAIASCVALVLIELIPSLVWLIVGIGERDDVCQEFADGGGTTLADWLIKHGALGVFSFICDFSVQVLVFFPRVRVLLWIITALHYITDVVFLAFLIWGSIALSRDVACETLNSTLYNTVLAAIVVGFGTALIFMGTFTGSLAYNLLVEWEKKREERKLSNKGQV
mmetsp:Transcript_33736/g.94937  ORF Transcript_33736/g.94937 Transcript_33736/m.94937 type:complete len:179 (+) Transcript_33736:46-582(+)